MNLLVNGQVVRSAVGMGDREDLSALQWNVNNLIGSNATIQIVDAAAGCWWHINVDQIVQTDTSLSSVVTITNRYLCLPVKTGATRHFRCIKFTGKPQILVCQSFYSYIAKTYLADVAGHRRVSLKGEGALRQPSPPGRKRMFDICI